MANGLRKRKTSDGGADSGGAVGTDRSEAKDNCCGCFCFLKFVFWLAFVSATAGGFFWMYQEHLKADEKVHSVVQKRLNEFKMKLKTQVQKELQSGIRDATENFVSFDALDRASSELKQQIDGATRQTIQSFQEPLQSSVSGVSERLQQVENTISGPIEELKVRVNSLVTGAQLQEDQITQLHEQIQQTTDSASSRFEQLQQLQQAAEQQAKQTADALQQRLQQVESGTPDLQKFKEEMFTDLENYFNLKYLKNEAAAQLKQELGNEIIQVVDQTYSKTADSSAALQQTEQRLASQLQQELAALRQEMKTK